MSHRFLIGYYNRNWPAEVDIPVGPNNRFESGDPDRGQPTHFLPNRNFGMFSVVVPKNFSPTEHLYWSLTLNGTTSCVAMILSPDFNITPQRSSEESPNGKYNVPPVLRFADGGPTIQTLDNPSVPPSAGRPRRACQWCWTSSPKTMRVMPVDRTHP